MTSAREILIHGDGLAALGCARLLRNAGFRAALDGPERARVPAIMLSEHALALIRDVFADSALFAGLPRIERRVVSWGEDAEPVTVAHSAVVMSEAFLLGNLGRGLEGDDLVSPEFTIHTSPPLPPSATEHRFGARRAAAAEVALKDSADLSSCWIESLADGWLFLLPNARESTWLLAVGATVESLLDQSRVIAPRIDLLHVRSGSFSACPRMVSPLCGDGWITCGTVAVGFDPICGDGTANAIREAILACAVIRGIANGGDTASLFAHYESRLISGMLRHIGLCAEFYRTGGSGPWWRMEARSLAEGHRWCTAKLSGVGEPRYQLRDFVLECRS